MMEDVFLPITIVAILFIGVPWVIFHYVTKWKQSATLSGADEKMLDEMYEMARRLDDRLCTIERIMNAENPEWRQSCLPDAGLPMADEVLSARPSTRARRGQKA